MKRKIAITALVAFVSVSSLFAASSFKGKAVLRLGVQKLTNEEEVKYGLLDKTKASAELYLLENTKNLAGKGSTYGEISAYAQIRVREFQRLAMDNNWYKLDDSGFLQMRLGLNYANLVFDADKNFKLGIAGISPAQRYAKGWEVELDNGNTIGTTPFMTYNTAFKKEYVNLVVPYSPMRAHGGVIPALTLTYGKAALSLGLVGGFGRVGDNKNPNYLVMLQGNDMVVADGFKLSGNIGIYHNKELRVFDYANLGEVNSDQTHLLFGAKFDYKKDDVSFVAGVTGNAKIASPDGLAYTDVNESVSTEASINFAYTGDVKASIDAWWLDNQALWSNDDEPDEVTYDNSSDLGFVYRNADGQFLGEAGDGSNNVTLHKALSVRANIKPVDAVGFTLRGQDLLNQGILGLDVPVKVSDDVTITPSVTYTLDTKKTYRDGAWVADAAGANPIIEGQLAVNYKHSLFSLFGYVRLGSEYNAAAHGGSAALWIVPYLDIVSKTLIDGARLTLRWQKGCFNLDGMGSATPSGKKHGGSGIGEIYLEARIDFK